ncbi:MAG TPA: DUF2589 domain-containing protein [Symbiobacteriaceae bacterium]|nr:DUF2589 domain-containing protein [Symbiobacteriaceae bacterium]
MSLPVPQGILPIEYLLAAPLEALVRAQAMAAQTTADFVGQVGFETAEDGVTRARMVDFEYLHSQADPNQPGNMLDTPVRVRVPVLSLLTVPNVTVEEASVDLQLRIMGQQAPTIERPTTAPVTRETPRINPNDPARLQSIARSPLLQAASGIRLVGSIAAPKLADQSASLKVAIKLKQAPTPSGIQQILDLLGESTAAHPADGR